MLFIKNHAFNTQYVFPLNSFMISVLYIYIYIYILLYCVCLTHIYILLIYIYLSIYLSIYLHYTLHNITLQYSTLQYKAMKSQYNYSYYCNYKCNTIETMPCHTLPYHTHIHAYIYIYTYYIYPRIPTTCETKGFSRTPFVC